MNRALCFAFSFFILFSCTGPKTGSVQPVPLEPYNYEINKRVENKNGVVVSAHPLASKVGVEIMKLGGNAVDAAIATQFALAVVYPGAGNLGGGGFLVARLADGKNLSIDYREKAPALAHRDMYLDSAGNVDSDKSMHGHLASGVPGTVAGIFASHKYARLSMAQLVQPAIDLAANGFVLTAGEARGLNYHQEEFNKHNTVIPVFVNAQKWKAGDTLRQPDLALTLTRIRDHGKKGFYEGETARLIVEEMQRGKGLITLRDLKQYQAKERKPVIFDYKGYTIITMPLPSSGGIVLPQMMKMIEERDIARYGFHSWQAVQLMTEVERRAYADRATYLGDADFVKVPVEKLLSREYLSNRMRDYDPQQAGKSSPDVLMIPESEETTHLSVYDKDGNAVAVTTTLNGGYGSKTVVGGAGFLLNNEMDDFSAKPGVPNMYGALGNSANAIEPGKRMLSSMTPTIVLKENKPFLVVGTPGGTTIPTSVFQTLVNILEFGMSTTDAVNKPKFHHQWFPDEISVEASFPNSVRSKLESVGYKVVQRGSIGRTEVIRISEDGTIEGVADKRGDDAAEGF